MLPASGTGTLDQVTLAMDLDVLNAGNLFIQGGLTLSGGSTVHLISAPNAANLFVTGTQTLGGTGSVTFEGTTSNGRIVQSGGTTLTIGPNVTVGGVLSTQGGTVGFFTNVINQGLIEAATAGKTITTSISTALTNTGTLRAINGGTLDIGAGDFPTNAGTITIGAGSTLDTSTTALTNTGILEIAGTLDLSGQTLTNSNILGPGTSPGITTIDGDLILDTNSIVDIEISGTDPIPPEFDIINVTGSATIDGTLNVIHFGGYTPTLGDTFEIITAVGGTSGQFTTLNFPGGFPYDHLVKANEVLLLFTNGGVFWDEGGDGLTWEDPDNWSADAIPGVADDVLIAFGGGNTVTFNTSASINSLAVNDTLQLQDNVLTLGAGTSSVVNGTLSSESATATLTGGAGSTITFDGTFDWTAGTISNPLGVTVSATGELLMTGGGTKTFASTVLSHQSATGASVWTDGLLNGTFGGALNNSGLIDFSGFGSVVGTAPGTFTNSGTITVSADGPRIDTGTDNTGGLIHVTGGQLRHTVGWTNAGTVQVDSGTLFIVDGGAFGNTGTVISNDGTLAAGASPGKTVINMPLTLLSNSIIEAELGGTNQGVDYDWIEVINNAVTLGGTLNVTHFGGFTPSSNDQFLIITAATGGVSGSFATINTPAGFAYTTTVNPNDFTVEFQFIPDTFWDDGGDGLNWTDPDNWSTDLVPGGGDNVLIAFGGGNTVTLASGTQATNQLVTQDTLTVSGGTLDVSGNAGLDATLTLTGGTTTLTGGGNLTDLDIVNGDLFVNTTPLTVSDLSITGSGGVLGGDTDVTVTSAGTWSSGSMFGTGKTIVGGGAVLDINLSNAKTLDTRELENLGVINWNDGGVFVQNGPTLDNQGTFNALLSGLSRTFNFNGGALGTFTNTSTFIGNTGAAVATFDMALNHTGATAMDIQSGTVVFNDGGTSSGDFGIQTGATVVFATAGNETHALSGTISGAGSVGLGTAGSSGIVNLDASSVYDIGATTQIIGGTANFDGTLLDLGVRLLGTAGVANFDETNGPIVHGLDDLDIVNAQLFFNVNDVQTTNLTITGSSGVLGGDTDVTVTSAGTWSSGSMFGTGKTIVGGGAHGTTNRQWEQVTQHQCNPHQRHHSQLHEHQQPGPSGHPAEHRHHRLTGRHRHGRQRRPHQQWHGDQVCWCRHEQHHRADHHKLRSL